MNQMTTGASNDFERATAMARDMVTRYGMSDLGVMVYGENEGEVFLGRSVTQHKNVSEATMQKVDAEIRRIIDQQYALARKLLEENRDKVEAMTRRCSNGKPSIPIRSTTSWPASRRARQSRLRARHAPRRPATRPAPSRARRLLPDRRIPEPGRESSPGFFFLPC
jgi:hypothetical protein